MEGVSASDFLPPAALRRGQSGRSRLLVGEELAVASTGIRGARNREERTVLPVDSRLLAGVDDEGNEVPVDPTEVEASLDMYSVLIEYSKIQQFAPEGIYCMPTWNDIRTWDGVVFPRHGVYKGGVFKFRIAIPREYPNAPPSVMFLTRLVHPLVDLQTGELCISAYFETWDGEKDYILTLLLYMKSIFFSKDLLKGTADKRRWRNETAAMLFRDDKAALLSEIQECVKQSQETSLVPADKEKLGAAAADPEEREPPTAASALLQEGDSDFVFDFKAFHRQQKPILNAISLLAVDETCVDPTLAFVEWFVDDWCKSEFGKEGSKAPK